jgi:hypothetical protein
MPISAAYQKSEPMTTLSIFSHQCFKAALFSAVQNSHPGRYALLWSQPAL